MNVVGAAEGEHLLTKLRRQFMTGDGSENEIDTDDELEAARKVTCYDISDCLCLMFGRKNSKKPTYLVITCLQNYIL